MSLQILNLSIDADYAVDRNLCPLPPAGCDDIDSFFEYILENILGDSNFFSENDDDDENGPQNQGIEKYNVSVLYFEQLAQLQLLHHPIADSSCTTGLDQANKISKGYFDPVSPPPKA